MIFLTDIMQYNFNVFSDVFTALNIEREIKWKTKYLEFCRLESKSITIFF